MTLLYHTTYFSFVKHPESGSTYLVTSRIATEMSCVFVVSVEKSTLKSVMQDGTSKPHGRSNSCKQDDQDESFGCLKTPKTDLA